MFLPWVAARCLLPSQELAVTPVSAAVLSFQHMRLRAAVGTGRAMQMTLYTGDLLGWSQMASSTSPLCCCRMGPWS